MLGAREKLDSIAFNQITSIQRSATKTTLHLSLRRMRRPSSSTVQMINNSKYLVPVQQAKLDNNIRIRRMGQ